MVQRTFNFLVVCLLMFYGTTFGQKNTQNNQKIDLETGFNGNYLVSGSKWKTIKSPPDQAHPSVINSSCIGSLKSIQTIPFNYHMQQLGFICKAEWKLEKISPLAFRFRLGSLDYVNYLEGK